MLLQQLCHTWLLVVVLLLAASDTVRNELGRVALTSTIVSSAVVTYVATFGAGTGTGAVTEAALANASSAELCYVELFSVVNKGSADSMTPTWTVTVIKIIGGFYCGNCLRTMPRRHLHQAFKLGNICYCY